MTRPVLRSSARGRANFRSIGLGGPGTTTITENGTDLYTPGAGAAVCVFASPSRTLGVRGWARVESGGAGVGAKGIAGAVCARSPGAVGRAEGGSSKWGGAEANGG